MPLISDDYREMNATLHENEAYGKAGWKWVGPVLYYATMYECAGVLDYGAGKGSLAQWMPTKPLTFNYDPVTFPEEPEAQDLVACLDVLEHIEPENLDAVLQHIRAKTLKVALLVIATREAKKTLPDGRNAHLIVEDHHWWEQRLKPLFDKLFRLEKENIAGAGEVVFLALV